VTEASNDFTEPKRDWQQNWKWHRKQTKKLGPGFDKKGRKVKV
jgi:hypothetical protein